MNKEINEAFENGEIFVNTHFPFNGAKALVFFHETLSISSRLYENQGILCMYLNLDPKDNIKWTYIHGHVIRLIEMICEKGILMFNLWVMYKRLIVWCLGFTFYVMRYLSHAMQCNHKHLISVHCLCLFLSYLIESFSKKVDFWCNRVLTRNILNSCCFLLFSYLCIHVSIHIRLFPSDIVNVLKSSNTLTLQNSDYVNVIIWNSWFWNAF